MEILGGYIGGIIMKKLLLLLLSVLCLAIAGCSAEKEEKVEAKEANGIHKETIEMKLEGSGVGDIISSHEEWEYTTNDFTTKISSLLLMSSKKEGKPIVTGTIDVSGTNKSDQDVYNVFSGMTIESDNGRVATIDRTDMYTKENVVKRIAAGKKYMTTIMFTFEDISDYKSIKHIEVRMPVKFGADDDAYQTVKRNDITIKIK